MLHHLINIH